MAGSEDEAQEVVADAAVPDVGSGLRRGRCAFALEFPREHRVLPGEPLVAPEPVDRAPLRDGHEPGARVVRDA